MYKIIEKRLDLPLAHDWAPIDYSSIPDTTAADYQNRIDRLWHMPEAKDYACLIIYADREHFSNMHYLTGYDPRFEESLLILVPGRTPILIVGNEGLGYTKNIPYEIDIKLYQRFSLMGQPNENGDKLAELLATCAIPDKGLVGLVGFKHYGDARQSPMLITDVPHYIVQTLDDVIGMKRIRNATDLFADCVYGLKHQLSAKEIVQFEAIGTKVSRGVYRSICDLRPNVSEIEASQSYLMDGEPSNTHPNLNFGDVNVAKGLASPSYHQTLHYGDFVSTGYGRRGTLVHRIGIYARNADDIPQARKDYLEEHVKPYFASVVRWYEMMQLGRKCGEIWQMVEDWIGFDKFNIILNPGHLMHTDEWTNSPFVKDSAVRISSGMAFQCDYTVTFKEPYMACHMEDSLVIADKALREAVQALSPECWKRIEARRNFMIHTLNIALPEEVLPLSDLSGVYFPYMADTRTILAKV